MLCEGGDRGTELLAGSAFSEEFLFEEDLAEWFGFDMFFRGVEISRKTGEVRSFDQKSMESSMKDLNQSLSI
jgi:hypothetical protein